MDGKTFSPAASFEIITGDFNINSFILFCFNCFVVYRRLYEDYQNQILYILFSIVTITSDILIFGKL